MDEAEREALVLLAVRLNETIEAAAAEPDAQRRLVLTNNLQKMLYAAYIDACRARRNAMVQLHHGDLMRLEDIGALVGIGKARVEQILNIPPKKQRKGN
jgi:hypothetical protein